MVVLLMAEEGLLTGIPPSWDGGRHARSNPAHLDEVVLYGVADDAIGIKVPAALGGGRAPGPARCWYWGRAHKHSVLLRAPPRAGGRSHHMAASAAQGSDGPCAAQGAPRWPPPASQSPP